MRDIILSAIYQYLPFQGCCFSTDWSRNWATVHQQMPSISQHTEGTRFDGVCQGSGKWSEAK